MDLNTILNIMGTWNLTGDELLLVYLTFLAQTENGNSQEGNNYFVRWYNNGGKSRLRDLFNSLKEKGIIHKNYNPETYDPDEIEFNSNFIKKYFKLSGELGQELWEAYPNNLFINGQIVSLKNFSKKFLDRSELYFWYSTTIGHSIDKHKKILSILDWAKKNDLVHVSLLEFISSCKWEEYEEMKNNGVRGQANTGDLYDLA